MPKMKRITREVSNNSSILGRLLVFASMALYIAGIGCYTWGVYSVQGIWILVAPMFLAGGYVLLAYGTLLAMGKKVEETEGNW